MGILTMIVKRVINCPLISADFLCHARRKIDFIVMGL